MEIDNILFQYEEGIISGKEAYFRIKEYSELAAKNFWKIEFRNEDYPNNRNNEAI